MFSRCREKSSIFVRETWAWTRSPSYLYSRAAFPIRVKISSSVSKRSASIARIGRNSFRRISSRPLSPFVEMTRATSPRSEETL